MISYLTYFLFLKLYFGISKNLLMKIRSFLRELMPYHSHTDNLLYLSFPMDNTSLSIFHDSTFYFILGTSLIMIYSYYILSIHLRKNNNYRLYLVANFLNRFLFSIFRNWLCSNWCFLLMVIYYHAKAYLSIYFYKNFYFLVIYFLFVFYYCKL